MYQAQTQDYTDSCSDIECEIIEAQESEARRRDLIALHVAGRKEFGKAWDAMRPLFIMAATDARTGSAREATRQELQAALENLERHVRNAHRPALVSPNGFGSDAEARRRDAEPTPAYMYMDDAAAGISSYSNW